MQNAKLIILYQALSNRERNALEKWINSPFHNQHERVTLLFQYLKSLKKFDDTTLSEQVVFRYIFDATMPFNAVKLRYVRSYLLKLIEEFLAYNQWKKDESAQLHYLAKDLQTRKQDPFFQSVVQQATKLQAKQPHRNIDYHKKQYEWQLLEFSWMEKQNRRGKMNQQELIDNLDIAFIAEKLKQACTIFSHEMVYKTPYDYGLLEVILQIVNQPKYLTIPAISVYYWSYQALKNPTEEVYFQQFKQELSQYFSLFPISEGRELYLLAINYCIRRINLGSQDYIKELFEIYKEGLAKDALLENKTLSRWTYRNIVAIGLDLQEFQWTYQFIHQYKSYLPLPYRTGMFSYNLAAYHYHQRKYEQAIDLLVAMKKEQDVLIQMSTKILLAKIYYELDEIRLLSSYLHSFELYVRRQKAIGYHQQNYLNFIRFLKKLTTLNFFDKAAIKKMEERIKAMEILPERKWLLEQLFL